MGTMDVVPLYSRIKLLCQAMLSDSSPTHKEQGSCVKHGSIVSRVENLIQLVTGDKTRALVLPLLTSFSNRLDSMPIVGHIKGCVHYRSGNRKKGNVAMKRATKATAVMLCGIGGCFICGTPGGVIVGAIAGIMADIIITVVAGKPFGCIEVIQNVIRKPCPESILDLILMVFRVTLRFVLKCFCGGESCDITVLDDVPDAVKVHPRTTEVE